MQPDTNWVTLLATNDRRGGVAAAARKPPTELIWKVTLGDAIRSSPVLRDGVLYVTCRDGRLYAFDSGNGNLEGATVAQKFWDLFTARTETSVKA